MRIGVISVQGAISEHIDAVTRAASELGIECIEVIHIRKLDELKRVDALIIPGGESTTISKLMVKFDLFDTIIKRAKDDDLPILGTCAGCILLSTEGDLEVKKTETRLLQLMSMRVNRNFFGRQRESFESDIKIELPGFSRKYHAVFIRAPVIEHVWGDCKVISKLKGNIIFSRQGNLLAATFHPELTDDMRVHKYFLNLV